MKLEKQKKPFNISTKPHSSMTYIKTMEDENYLMASNLDGMVSNYGLQVYVYTLDLKSST